MGSNGVGPHGLETNGGMGHVTTAAVKVLVNALVQLSLGDLIAVLISDFDAAGGIFEEAHRHLACQVLPRNCMNVFETLNTCA